jgi:hypothetical protein
MNARSWPPEFLVAFSLAGEQRELVRAIAEAVERRLGHGTVFFDEWFEHYLGGDDADLKLQKLYGGQCSLAVWCVSKEYGSKPWTQAENAAIRARVMKARASSDQREKNGVLPIRVGDGDENGDTQPCPLESDQPGCAGSCGGCTEHAPGRPRLLILCPQE